MGYCSVFAPSTIPLTPIDTPSGEGMRRRGGVDNSQWQCRPHLLTAGRMRRDLHCVVFHPKFLYQTPLPEFQFQAAYLSDSLLNLVSHFPGCLCKPQTTPEVPLRFSSPFICIVIYLWPDISILLILFCYIILSLMMQNIFSSWFLLLLEYIIPIIKEVLFCCCCCFIPVNNDS